MKIHFDLISDLHIDTWDEEFSWEGKATSPYAVIIGDVSRERADIRPALQEISKNYEMTMFVDGNDEHRWGLDDLRTSYQTLEEDIGKRSPRCNFKCHSSGKPKPRPNPLFSKNVDQRTWRN